MKYFYNDYVNQMFDEWKEKYNIPGYYDFELRAMLALKKQFVETPDDHVKKKRDLLIIINDIKNSLSGSCNIEDKSKTKSDINISDCTIKGDIRIEDKFNILIVTNTNDNNMVKLFKKIIGEQFIETEKGLNQTNYYYRICHKNCILTFMIKDEFKIRGYKFDDYINLTGDREFEENYLRPMIT